MGRTILHPREKRQRSAYLGVALLSSILALLLWMNRPGSPLLDRIDRLTLDAQLQWRGPVKPAGQVLLVSIDDASLRELGTLAPDRAQVAQVIDKLTEGKARVIGLDTLFLSPARPDPASDDALAAAMKRSGRVLIPFALPAEAARMPGGAMPDVVVDNAFTRVQGEFDLGNTVLKPAGAVLPVEPLARATAGMGHVTSQTALDGAMRFDLPGLSLDGELYPSMALRMAAMGKGAAWSKVEFVVGREVRLGPDLAVPLDPLSRQWINYYGPAGTLETVPFIDVLQGKVPPERFADRVIIVGTAALGAGDTVPSPFDGGLPGVERLGTVVDNILGGRVLSHPGWGSIVEIASMLVLPLLAVYLIAALRPMVAQLVLAGLVLAIAVALQWLLVRRHEFLAPVFPLLSLGLAGLGAEVRRSIAEQGRRKIALEQLRASEERYALAIQGAKDGMWDWDIGSGEVYFSERWMQLMRLGPEQARDMGAWTSQLDLAGRQQFEDVLAEHLGGRSQQLNHVLNFRQGGGEVWLLVRGVATRDAANKPLRMAGSLTDISQERQLQHQITFDALHDRLTGLPNRAAFLERLAQVFTGTGAAPHAGVVVLDLDGFRALNESQGTTAGDAVLHEVGRRLRTRDGAPLNVARLGADRFGLLFTQPLGDTGVDETRLAHWALAQLRAPFQVAGASTVLTASIGWAHTTQGLSTPGELMSAAEMALAHAKAHRRGHIHMFDQAELLVENSRRWLKENIQLALERQEFKLYYQPLVRLTDRKLIGFEALIRWPHPVKGMVMPGDFIPFAEESGQIVELGRWTLQEVARQLVAWNAIGFTGEIAVNLSGVQFTEGDLEADARGVLGVLGGISPRRIKLEVTESMAMANPQRTALVLQTLAALGFKISIDDFGTGYSSLAYLHRFPFDTLKIDRSFVIRLATGREAVEIVRTIVGLALALDKQVLAEGVEEEAQALLLQQLGVHVGQGWLFAKALPADQAQALFTGSPSQIKTIGAVV
ncbi:EAL domain-containing protein [Pelomonas sp. KK5]|uniref:EAL domain-containing protein n=1 Tax=Pelomonas sp. KK5 TaxID=1855730 RepID=UPI00097BAC84|nr:EAL domain-containing protein [Pelomonas sp. KK5]